MHGRSFINLLRDPVDRVESHIKHSIAQGRFALDKFSLTRPSLIFPSLYAFQLDEILKHFERRQVLLLGFTDLVSAPAKTLRRVETFLGLQSHDYGTIAAQNTRSLQVDGKYWHLSVDSKKQIADQVVDDVDRLSVEYGFEARHHFRTFFSLTG
jgi:Sulfotransferase family